ncbi:MAG: basic amino acid ABC transporter substrate-binding protein [Succinivibrio sp.]
MNHSKNSSSGLKLREAAASAIVLACGIAALSAFPARAERLTVTVATGPAFAPFEYTDEKTKELAGFDIDIIKAVAEEGGFDVKISSLPLDAIIPAVVNGTVDAAIAAIPVTKEQARKVDFTEPYYEDAGLGIMASDKVKDSIKTKDDLKGMRVCVQRGTPGAALASKIKGAEVTEFNSAPETYAALEKGGCDAVVNDYPVHAYYMVTAEPSGMTLLPDRITSEQYAIAMSKSKPKAEEAIRAGLAKVRSNGHYEAVFRKWFSDAGR